MIKLHKNVISWQDLDKLNLEGLTTFPGSPPAIFMHIPKTGGRTFQTVLTNNFSLSNLYHIPGDRDDYNSHFANMPESVRNRIRMVLGHIKINDKIFTQFNEPFYYFTMLRDPVKRVVSQYNFLKKHPFSKLRQYMLDNNTTIEEFVTDKKRFGDQNIMVSYLSGSVPAQQRISAAKNNLENTFTFFGLTEEYDELLVIIKKIMKLDDIFYRRVNVSKKNSKPMSDETTKLVSKCVSADLEIYYFAQELYKTRIDSLGSDFQNEVLRFKELNSMSNNIPDIESAGDKYNAS